MTQFSPTPALLTGFEQHHLQFAMGTHLLLPPVALAFTQLANAMARDGITLQIASAWRSFERQAAIWQAKCEGRRPVYNIADQPIIISDLSGLSKLEAIMLFSALPGASRHHWGTEIDVFDSAAIPANYALKLHTAEYEETGPFYKLAKWLKHHAADFGFFLPYRDYQGGVAAEPWHLSYRPLATICQQHFTLPLLQTLLVQHPIAEQQTVLDQLPYLYNRFITNICEA